MYLSAFCAGSQNVKALLGVTEEFGAHVSRCCRFIAVLHHHPHVPQAAVIFLVSPLERVIEDLHRYNLLDLRRVDVHFHKLVVAIVILWLTLRIGSLALQDLPLVES